MSWAAIEGLPPGCCPVGIDLGIVGNPDAELEALMTIDGQIGSAADLAAFATALLDGRLISEDSLGLIFDEEIDGFSMGFDRHGIIFGDLGDSGRATTASVAATSSATGRCCRLDPESGDIIVVTTSSIDLFPPELAREIAVAWAEADREK